MIVVSNTSPIINLAAIGQSNLLYQLYEKIIIPKVVNQEIAIVGSGQLGVKDVSKLDWITTQQVSNQALVKALQIELDKGEAEAIALTVELKADLLLIDERLGRSVASRFDLKFIGILGLLIEAKHKGLIQKVEPILDDLKTKAGFWINQSLYVYVLVTAGE